RLLYGGLSTTVLNCYECRAKKDVTFPMESYCNSLLDPIGAPHLGFGSYRQASLPKTSTSALRAFAQDDTLTVMKREQTAGASPHPTANGVVGVRNLVVCANKRATFGRPLIYEVIATVSPPKKKYL
ncbi:MAG: hypothetical protein IJW29_03550, partial [Clostridia bacterium]|nr:hypothetical protein [Clostridia bacterium]